MNKELEAPAGSANGAAAVTPAAEESSKRTTDRRSSRAPAAVDPPPARRAILEPLAAQAGQAWLDWQCQVLSAAGRPRAGGWPGTIPEARRWIQAELAHHGTGGSPATAEEINWLTETAYAVARKRWLLTALPDDG